MHSIRRLWYALVCVALASAPGIGLAQSPKIGDPPEAQNMRLAGYDDLQARSAYQPTIHLQNGRWIAYVGHHGGTEKIPRPYNPLTGRYENNGTSIVDVTDPRRPKYLRHIPGEEGTGESGGAQMVRVCDGKSLPKGDPSKVYMLRTFGSSAHEVWDVSDPANPAQLVRLDGLKGTHKSWWECDSGIAYLVSGLPDWRVRRMTQVYDLSEPAHPVFIRNFGLPGQQPGGKGDPPTELHGMISTGPKGNRIYFGYGTNQNGILQIVDRQKLLSGPKDPTAENLLAPEVGRLYLSPLYGAHTTFPMLGMRLPNFAYDTAGAIRDFVVITDEELVNECREAQQQVWFVDVSTESKPFPVANFMVPDPSGAFCRRGGRFGSHSSNENMTPIYYGKLMFFAHFNAGVRAVDVRDPFHPREVGYFIPSITKNTDSRCIDVGGQPRCKVAIQTNNVEVDDRGYIYIVDRANTGLHILELTGAARSVSGLR